MTKKLTALLGFHNLMDLVLAYEVLKIQGYNPAKASTPAEMIALAKEKEFDAYHWDVNFGNPGSIDISFSENFWPLIRDRYKLGQIKALASTATQEAIEIAKKKAFPVKINNKF